MYTLAVMTQFTASHFLIGGDWGEENSPHAHHYRAELQLAGEALDRNEYLADIVEVRGILEAQVGRYRGRMLNSLPEFSGRNPSIELLAQALCSACAECLRGNENVGRVRVKVWENEEAWVSCAGNIKDR